MDNKKKLDMAIGLLRMAREQMDVELDLKMRLKRLDVYNKADKETFERLLDAEGENKAQEFLKHKYIKQGMEIERTRLLGEIGELARKYGIEI